MRNWMLNPSLLCRKHLLGEHVECHMIAGSIRKGKKLDGFKGLIEPQSLEARHKALAAEMLKRGYKHKSPLPEVDLGGYQDFPRVDLAKSADDLIGRCSECFYIGTTQWKDNGIDRDSWDVTLKGPDGQSFRLETGYHKGLGRRKMTPYKKIFKVMVGGQKTYYPEYFSFTVRTLFDEEVSKKYKPVDPTVEEVLGSLAADAACVEDVRCYEDFADELGYDPDSRRGEEVYRACQRIAADLSRFLGESEYQKLLYEVERD